MRKNLFKEAIPAERDHRSAGEKYRDSSVVDMLHVEDDTSGSATAKLISFLKKEKFSEYQDYFRKTIKLFGENYDVYVPYVYKKGTFTVVRWFIEPGKYNRTAWAEWYNDEEDWEYLNPSFVKIVERYGLKRMKAYIGDDPYYGLGLRMQNTEMTSNDFVNKLLVVYNKLEKVKDSYNTTSQMDDREYYTYKGKLPNNNLQINVFYVDGENGCTIEYDCEVLGEDLKCYVESENSAVGLDLNEPSITKPFFEVLAEEGIIEEEDVDSLAEEFDNGPTYNYLQIFDVSDWPKYFEMVGEFLKAEGYITEYNVEASRAVNSRRKNRIKNNPNLRQQYESRISKISRRMREAEEDWDDLGYDDSDAGVEDWDDPNEALDGEDYFTYDDPDYTGMNSGERAYDHYDSDMEDVIADSMPTRKKGLGIGKKRGDSSYFNKDYLDAPDMWDENGDNVPEEIEWKLTKKVAESKKPFKTRLY